MGEELEIKENVDAGMNAETIADMNAVVQGVDAPTQPKKPNVIVTLLKAAAYVAAYVASILVWWSTFAAIAMLETKKSLFTDFQWSLLEKDTDRFMALFKAVVMRTVSLRWYALVGEPLLLLFLFLFFKIRKQSFTERTGFQKCAPVMLLAGVLLGVGSRLIFDSVDLVIPLKTGGWTSANAFYDLFISDNTKGLSAVLCLTAGGLFIPIAEEVIFRGLAFRHLMRIWPFAVSAVVLSVIFGALHWPPFFMIMIGVWSVGLCLQADRSGSIVPGVVSHVIFNLAVYSMPCLGLHYSKWMLCWMVPAGIICLVLWFLIVRKKKEKPFTEAKATEMEEKEKPVETEC